MSNGKALTVIAYDIESDSARRRVADYLEQRAVRVQKSVFEARLTLNEMDRVAAALTRLVGAHDSIRLYRLGELTPNRARIIGRGVAPLEGPFLIF